MKRPQLLFGLLVMGGLLFVLWLRLHQPPNTVDDAYITFRYAHRLASGAGLTYNDGERVLGTTTPAYALLLASLSAFTRFDDYPRLALFLNALFDTLTFCLLTRLVGRLSGHRALGLVAAGLYALDGYALDFSTGGMETSFYVAAILLTLILFFENRPQLAAAGAGLVLLIRPDGGILALVLFAAWGWDALRQAKGWRDWPGLAYAHLPWRAVPGKPQPGLIFAGVVAPWIIFAWAYYGSPLPHSVIAKAVWHERPAFTALSTLLVQLRAIFPFSIFPLRGAESFGMEILRALFPASLCALGLLMLHRRQRRIWVIGAYIVGFIAFFAIGNPYWFGWYQVPLMPFYQFLILAAAAFAPAWVLKRTNRPAIRISQIGLVGLAAGLMALPQLSRLNLIPWEPPLAAPWTLNTYYTNVNREADYALLGEVLQPAAHAGRLAAIREIGAFGYTYPGQVYDISGLVTPDVLVYRPFPENTRAMLFAERPDLFISLDGFIEDSFSPQDPEFLQLYRPAVGLVSHAVFGMQRLIAYRRADLPSVGSTPEAAAPPSAQVEAMRFGPDLFSLEGFASRMWEDPETRFLEATLFWRNGNTPLQELLVQINLLSATGEQVYQVLYYPGEGLFPTSSWAPGMWLVDRYQLKRPTPEAGPYTVTVTVFDEVTGDIIPAYTSSGLALPEGRVEFPAR